MGIGTGIAIYFIIWWLMIFITLPFRMRPQLETGEVIGGTDPSAPAHPQLLKRMIWNTILSGIVFGLYWLELLFPGLSISRHNWRQDYAADEFHQ